VTGLARDLRYALRGLLKAPGFTAAAVAILALALGANTAIYGWVRETLLAPLPGVENAGRVVAVETLTQDRTRIDSSWADYADLSEQAKSFAGLVAFQDRHVTLTERDDSRRLYAVFVSGNFFDVLEVGTVLGRTFLPEEGRVSGGTPVAVVSYGFWGSHFGYDRAVIGRTVRLNDQPLTVVGVAAPEFRGPVNGLNYEVYVPLATAGRLGGEVGGDRARLAGNRTNRWLHMMGRLRPGVSIAAAQAEADTIASRLSSAYPDSNRGLGFRVEPVTSATYGAPAQIGGVLVALFAAVGVVLLIACGNVANLVLVRALERRREIAVRLALGATRWRVARQLVIESTLLSLAGGAAGFLLVPYVNRLFTGLLPRNQPLPVDLEPRFDLRLFVFGFGLALASGIAFGLFPALRASRSDLDRDLKDGAGAAAGRERQRARRLLVVAQLALSLLLLAAAGLFLRSLQRAARIDPGFDRANVVVAGFDFPASIDRLHSTPFYRALLERVRALPGVVSASYGNHVPLWLEGFDWEDVRVNNYAPGPDESMKILVTLTWPGYFSVMRMPLTAGRDFTEHDDSGSAPVVIVNEAFASRYLGGRPAVGSRIHIRGGDALVVGVARTARYRSLTEEPRPLVYLPQLQTLPAGTAIHVRVEPGVPQTRILAGLRQEVRVIDPRVALVAGSLEELTSAAVAPQELGARLLGSLGAVALFIAAIGIYALMAYSVSLRRREIGIRLAVGAQPAQVRRMVLREGFLLAGAGLALGLLAAFALTRLLASVLIEVRPDDPAAIGAALLLLGFAALAACAIPAGRAGRVDPMTALRHE
jgi:putative ABC transport system permease protein